MPAAAFCYATSHESGVKRHSDLGWPERGPCDERCLTTHESTLGLEQRSGKPQRHRYSYSLPQAVEKGGPARSATRSILSVTPVGGRDGEAAVSGENIAGGLWPQPA